MRLLIQSITLLSSSLLVLLIVSTPLLDYMAPILGLFIITSVIFIIIRQRQKRGEVFAGSSIEVFTINTILLLAIFLTGGLSSGLYFLLYFLLFGVVFLFEPSTVFVLLISFIIVFLPSLSEGDLVSNLIKLGSLVFLAPISYFFGREFQRREHLEEEIEDKTGQILEDTKTLQNHAQDEEAIDEIEDIAEKAKELREESEKDE